MKIKPWMAIVVNPEQNEQQVFYFDDYADAWMFAGRNPTKRLVIGVAIMQTGRGETMLRFPELHREPEGKEYMDRVAICKCGWWQQGDLPGLGTTLDAHMARQHRSETHPPCSVKTLKELSMLARPTENLIETIRRVADGLE